MNVFDLSAKITLDKKDYDKGLDEASGKLSSVGEKLGSIGGKIASGIGTAMKVGAAAVGTASTAVGALVTKSVQAYGEYEQLTGGIKKLYGNMGMSLNEYAQSVGKSISEAGAEYYKLEAAQTTMLTNAQNAFRTAGMSANEYMQNVTGFSAALINSLGGDTMEAANAADMAMRDIADNANTFGKYTAQELAGVYQALAKGQYQTLDNLNLGFGGTKEGMQQLIDKANELAKAQGLSADLQIDSYADIVQAIHLVQTDMNITGTTAREAASTIQGSLSMAKAAWENLITGMSDSEADMDLLMDNMVNSIVGYTDEAGEHVNGVVDNILPVVEKALTNVGSMIDKLAPIIGEELPKIVASVLPSLLSAGANIVSSLVKGITSALPQLLFMAGDIIHELLQGLVDATNGQQSTLMEIINTILGVFEENYMDFIDMGMLILNNIIQGIINGLPDLIFYVQEIILHLSNALIDNLPLLIESGLQLILTLALGIYEALPQLIPTIVDVVLTIVQSLIENVDLLIDGAIALIEGLTAGLINALPILIEKAPEIIVALVTALIENAPRLLDASVQLIFMLVQGIIQAIPMVYEAILSLLEMLFTTIKEKLPEMLQAGKDIIDRFKNGIQAMKTAAKQAMVDVLTAIRDKVKEWFGQAKTWGQDMISNFVDGIKSKIGDAINAAKELGQSIKDYLGFSEPKYGPLSNFHTFAPDMVDLFAKGIYDSQNIVTKAISDVFDIGSYMTAPTFTPAIAGSYGVESGFGGGYNQTIIINSPTQLTPSEIARQTRNATRDMVLELRGK